MHIIHSLDRKKTDEHVKADVAFLITNKKGNYLSLGKDNFSHMMGLFFFEHDKWGLYKTIEDIKLDKNMTGIRNNFFNAQRMYTGGAAESFNLFNESMAYTLKNYTGEITLELDFRGIFDYDDRGRVYTITKEGKYIIIRFDKYKDDSLSFIDKTRFLAIRGAKDFKQIGEWIKKDYSYDKKRNSKSDFYVYKALSIKVDKNIKLAFSFAYDKEKAKEHAEKIYKNKVYLENSLKKYVKHTFNTKDIALSSAMKALDDLLMSIEKKDRSVGIFAGLPWFHQFWARDEFISLKALLLQEKYYLVKSILFKYLDSISDNGLIPSRLPGTSNDVKSIDAVGWLFMRIKDYLKALAMKKILNDYISVADLVKIKQQLEKTIQAMVHNHSSNGLIINNEQETWMDTKPASRKGACIEIQALFLSMIRLHNTIADVVKSKQLFKSLEKEHRDIVKKNFFNKGILYDCMYDGVPSDNIRPNIFLAYYIYPDLLSKKEWKQAFDNALKELWLGWGGLSTLGCKNPLFRSEYAGENDISYHNGDSWYYVNNYAALAMHMLDKKYYSKYIKAIVHASKEEMLFSGYIGCCAEISSAKAMRSEGCLSQAWSAASYIELWHGMHK